MEATELEFLRWMFYRVWDFMGPSDGDIRMSLEEEFTEDTGKKVPEGYKYE